MLDARKTLVQLYLSQLSHSSTHAARHSYAVACTTRSTTHLVELISSVREHDVLLLELVETGKNTGSGNTTEDVGSGTLHE